MHHVTTRPYPTSSPRQFHAHRPPRHLSYVAGDVLIDVLTTHADPDAMASAVTVRLKRRGRHGEIDGALRTLNGAIAAKGVGV